MVFESGSKIAIEDGWTREEVKNVECGGLNKITAGAIWTIRHVAKFPGTEIEAVRGH